MGKFNMKSRKASLFSAPRNSAPPALVGEARVGQVMAFVNALWANSPSSFLREIRRNDASNTLLASGASITDYTPVAGDVGFRLVPGEQATNIYGSMFAYGATTEIVAAAQVGNLPATRTAYFHDETLGGHGGDDLGYTGSGTLTIESDSSGGQYVIDANNHLVPNGTLGLPRGAPLTSGSVTVGDGTESCVVTVTVLPEHGATVRAAVGETNTTSQLKLALASSQRRWGDRIGMRPGIYNPSELRITLKRNTEPSQRAGGPVKPTMPYHPWVLNDAAKAGWITVEPMIVGTVDLRYLEIIIDAYQDWCVRFTGLTCRRYRPTGSWTTGTSIYVTSGGSIGWGMLQFDTNNFLGNGRMDCRPRAGAQNRGLFVFDNYFEEGQILCYASDSWVIGNEMQRVVGTADCIRHAMFKSAGGLDCLMAFNFLHNKAGSTSNDHADGIQGDWTGNNAPGLPTGDVDGYWSVGNIIVRGDGGGNLTFDFQAEFDADMPSTVRLKIVRVGGFVAASYGNGMTLSNAAPGSGIYNCGLIYDQSGGAINGGGAPRIRFDNEGQASANIVVKNCYAHTTVNNANISTGANPPGAIAFTDTNNIWDISAATWATDFDAPATGSNLQTIAGIMAAFNPKVGGRLLPGGGAEKIGPFGTGYINHLNRTATVPGVTLPYVPAYAA